MEIIPLVYLEDRKILTKDYKSELSVKKLLEQVDQDKKLYLLDIDGLEDDKPNLCLYKRIAEHRKIWVDSGPRDLGDIVDAVLAGANKITIRTDLWPEIDISRIREITENKVYSAIEIRNQTSNKIDKIMFPDADGVVVFPEEKHSDRDFLSRDEVKTLCQRYPTYIAETEETDLTYWKNIGAAGILKDLQTKGVEKHGL